MWFVTEASTFDPDIPCTHRLSHHSRITSGILQDSRKLADNIDTKTEIIKRFIDTKDRYLKTMLQKRPCVLGLLWAG